VISLRSKTREGMQVGQLVESE